MPKSSRPRGQPSIGAAPAQAKAEPSRYALADVAEAALFLAAFPTNALTGQSLIVSHGWFME